MSETPRAQYVGPEEMVRRLRRRLWLERVFWLAAFAAIVALHLGALPGGRRATLIAADGQPVAVVASRSDAERLMHDLKALSGLPADRVSFAQKVTLHSVPASRDPVQSDSKAMEALSEKLTPVTRAAAIVAGGEIVLALPTEEQAVTALSMLLREFSPKDQADTVGTVYFKENVKIDTRDVPPDVLYPSAEAAVAKIIEASSPRSEYKIKAGDSAWKIARDHDVTLGRLAAANPDVDMNSVRLGETLKIPGELPPLTVIARAETTEEVDPPGSGRTRKVRVTYENGAEIKREIIGRSAPISPADLAAARRRPENSLVTRGVTDPWRWRDEVRE
jgi:LysM repeat protein